MLQALAATTAVTLRDRRQGSDFASLMAHSGSGSTCGRLVPVVNDPEQTVCSSPVLRRWQSLQTTPSGKQPVHPLVDLPSCFPIAGRATKSPRSPEQPSQIPIAYTRLRTQRRHEVAGEVPARTKASLKAEFSLAGVLAQLIECHEVGIVRYLGHRQAATRLEHARNLA
jgi:hypothetical protein